MTSYTDHPHLYRASSLRRIEEAARPLPLMQRAGSAAAEWADTLLQDPRKTILVMAGPGNNGGDALEMAYQLQQRGKTVEVVMLSSTDALPPDAARACQQFIQNGGLIHQTLPPGRSWGLIVDGLFGIGLNRAPDGPYAILIKAANTLAQNMRIPLLALDCPSGLDADTGFRHGAAITATHTLSFISGKPGLFTAEGPDHCGIIRIEDLNLPQPFDVPADGQLTTINSFRSCLRPRRYNSHKGSHGSVGIIGGAHSMLGAALLSGRAALKFGAGRVFVGLLDPHAPGVDPLYPELMLRRQETIFDAEINALACGPGMGRSVQAEALLEQAIATTLPLVLDADALNILAFDPTLQKTLQNRTAHVLLTPHAAEAARLLDLTTADIQQDRIQVAQLLARRYRAWVALKGCGTIISDPKGNWWINTSGNPGLATAGSGDILTGMVVSLLAQNWPSHEALLAGCYLHGLAADYLVEQGIGPTGLCAGELVDAARHCLNHYLQPSRPAL